MHKNNIIILSGNSKITVMRRLDFDKYSSVRWIDEFNVFDFDLYETVTFNIKRGRTYAGLENQSGVKYAVRDISDTEAADMAGDPVFELLRYSDEVYRELKSFFLRQWSDDDLPFSFYELDLGKYMMLTRFVGYKRNFYNAIPFDIEENRIEHSFSKIAKQLHAAKNVPALFEASRLPNMKSVRKIVFENPELLFYLNELEKLWEIINNPDLFRTFLESKKVYTEVSALHKYPVIFKFYKEFVSVVGQKSLCGFISKGNNNIHNYAIKYIALNDYEKKLERKKWKVSFLTNTDELGSEFSVPIPIPNEISDILEWDFGYYSFVRLSNSKEYLTAGKHLENCLTDWRRFSGNVYGVIRFGKYVAAIEVADNTVVQAYTYQNGEIYEDEEIFSVFCDWVNLNHLEYELL